jgi:hypothetical protein
VMLVCIITFITFPSRNFPHVMFVSIRTFITFSSCSFPLVFC